MADDFSDLIINMFDAIHPRIDNMSMEIAEKAHKEIADLQLGFLRHILDTEGSLDCVSMTIFLSRTINGSLCTTINDDMNEAIEAIPAEKFMKTAREIVARAGVEHVTILGRSTMTGEAINKNDGKVLSEVTREVIIVHCECALGSSLFIYDDKTLEPVLTRLVGHSGRFVSKYSGFFDYHDKSKVH